MPIAKTYKRYAPLSSFGVVGSIRSNILLTDSLFQPGQYSSTTYGVTAAVENVIIWDVKKAEKVRKYVISLFYLWIQFFVTNWNRG